MATRAWPRRRRSLLLFRLRPTDGADGSLATGGFAGGLFGAPLGDTLSQPSHFSARSFVLTYQPWTVRFLTIKLIYQPYAVRRVACLSNA
jgi:hypothetical protein